MTSSLGALRVALGAAVFLAFGFGDFAAHAEAIYVSGNNVINEYTETGTFVQSFGTGVGTFQPVGLAFGADGFLYAANQHEVDKFDPTTGAFLGAVGSIAGSAVSVNGLTSGTDGMLYVQTNQLGLYRVDPTTGTTTQIPVAHCCSDGIAMNPAGGALLGAGGGSGKVFNEVTGAVFTSGLDAVNGLGFGPDGRLYAVTENDDVMVVGAGGGPASAFTADVLVNSGGMGYLAFDGAGDLWATSSSDGKVYEFDGTTGATLFEFKSSNNANGIAIGPFASEIPEPSSLGLLAVALGVLGFCRRRAA